MSDKCSCKVFAWSPAGFLRWLSKEDESGGTQGIQMFPQPHPSHALIQVIAVETVGHFFFF